jgi:hypothetical protein
LTLAEGGLGPEERQSVSCLVGGAVGVGPGELMQLPKDKRIPGRLAAQLQYLARLAQLRVLPDDPDELPRCRRLAVDADGAVRGWRLWRTTNTADGRLRLSSPIRKIVWTRGVLIAACPDACSRVAGRGCRCGIYAYSDPVPAKRWMRELVVHSKQPVLVGEVAGWGQVSIHTAGWRAERALIESLWSSGLSSTSMTALAGYYDVDVRPFGSASRLGL